MALVASSRTGRLPFSFPGFPHRSLVPVAGKTSDFDAQRFPHVFAQIFVVTRVYRDQFTRQGFTEKLFHSFAFSITRTRAHWRRDYKRKPTKVTPLRSKISDDR